MYDDIEPFEYGKVIERLCENYKDSKSNYYTELLKVVKSFNKDKQNDDNDQIVNQFIKCRDKCAIITIWPNSNLTKLQLDKLKKYMEEFGHIYYTKKIEISYEEAFHYFINYIVIKNG